VNEEEAKAHQGAIAPREREKKRRLFYSGQILGIN